MKNFRDPEQIAKRFWSYVEKTETCWLWTGGKKSGPMKYGQFTYRDESGRHTVATHIWSWEFHFGPLVEGQCVLHRCDNPPCVRPDHFFLGTRTDNANDRNAKGRTAKGEACGAAKLTEESVKQIRADYASGNSSQAELAKSFGVRQNTISRIVNGLRWQHVSMESDLSRAVWHDQTREP